jgi:hypothetical protein
VTCARPLALIPAYSNIDRRLASTLRDIGIPYLVVHGCADLPKARSRLLSDGLRTEADAFVFIDADIVASAEQIAALVHSEKLDPDNAVSGCYLIGEKIAAMGTEPMAVLMNGEPRFHRILLAGMGFAAVHRETAERLTTALAPVQDGDGEQWIPYFVPFILEQQGPDGELLRQYMSEDYAFWFRISTVAKAQLWLDSHVAPGHVKEAIRVPRGTVWTLGEETFDDGDGSTFGGAESAGL